jgi:histidinol-phosphate aminotransferase
MRLGDRTMEFSDLCAGSGVSVRPFPGEGARVSIGDVEANDTFLAAAEAFRG